MEIKMGRWRSFLDSLDTGGGHIFVLVLLIGIGILVYRLLDSTAGGQIITLAFGALLVLVKDRGTNRDQLAPTTTQTATVTTASAPPPETKE